MRSSLSYMASFIVVTCRGCDVVFLLFRGGGFWFQRIWIFRQPFCCWGLAAWSVAIFRPFDYDVSFWGDQSSHIVFDQASDAYNSISQSCLKHSYQPHSARSALLRSWVIVRYHAIRERARVSSSLKEAVMASILVGLPYLRLWARLLECIVWSRSGTMSVITGRDRWGREELLMLWREKDRLTSRTNTEGSVIIFILGRTMLYAAKPMFPARR